MSAGMKDIFNTTTHKGKKSKVKLKSRRKIKILYGAQNTFSTL